MWMWSILHDVNIGNSIQNRFWVMMNSKRRKSHTLFFLYTHHYFVTVSFWTIYPSLFHYFAAIQIRFWFNINLNRVEHILMLSIHTLNRLVVPMFPFSTFYFPFIYINLLLSLRMLDMRIGRAMKSVVIVRNSTRLLNQQVFSGSYR